MKIFQDILGGDSHHFYYLWKNILVVMVSGLLMMGPGMTTNHNNSVNAFVSSSRAVVKPFHSVVQPLKDSTAAVLSSSSSSSSRSEKKKKSTTTSLQNSSHNNMKLQSSKNDKLPENSRRRPISEEDVNRWLAGDGEAKFRKYRRKVFTADDWIRSRRPERFIDHARTIFVSSLLKELLLELQVLTISSTFVVVWNLLFIDGYDDFQMHHHHHLPPCLFLEDTATTATATTATAFHLPALQLPLAPFSLSITALGLLLTFRTNVSYARWNEARTAWGKVINDSRSIIRMGCIWSKSYRPNNVSDQQLQRLGDAVCSFSRSLMNRTLPKQEDEINFQEYLVTQVTDQEYANRLNDEKKHRPTIALAEITSILVEFQLNPIHQVEIEKVISGLCDALGACERIFTSPVPTFYTRHTARFLAIWLFTLPIGLYEPMKVSWNHWATIPITVILGGFFLGIEELATQMEEPFSILPMEQMCEGSIRTPVMEQIERSSNGKGGCIKHQNGGAGGTNAEVPSTPYIPIPATVAAPAEAATTAVPISTLSVEDLDKMYCFEAAKEEEKEQNNDGKNGNNTSS